MFESRYTSVNWKQINRNSFPASATLQQAIIYRLSVYHIMKFCTTDCSNMKLNIV